MNAQNTELLIADEDGPDAPAVEAAPAWAARLAVAGRLFVAVGVLIVLGVLVAGLTENLDVFCAGVTLGVAGGVLCSIASPVDPAEQHG